MADWKITKESDGSYTASEKKTTETDPKITYLIIPAILGTGIILFTGHTMYFSNYWLPLIIIFSIICVLAIIINVIICIRKFVPDTKDMGDILIFIIYLLKYIVITLGVIFIVTVIICIFIIANLDIPADIIKFFTDCWVIWVVSAVVIGAILYTCFGNYVDEHL